MKWKVMLGIGAALLLAASLRAAEPARQGQRDAPPGGGTPDRSRGFYGFPDWDGRFGPGGGARRPDDGGKPADVKPGDPRPSDPGRPGPRPGDDRRDQPGFGGGRPPFGGGGSGGGPGGGGPGGGGPGFGPGGG